MKPIIFSSNMVRAILDGRKTMTRRVIKPQPIGEEVLGFCLNSTDGTHEGEVGFGNSEQILSFAKMKYQDGDVLWVRETWGIGTQLSGGLIYKADYENKTAPLADSEKWKSSMFMPRVAARLFLRVVTVRTERLQDITEADAIQEGCGIRLFCEHEDGTRELIDWAEPPLVGFKRTWNSLNEKRGFSWNSNPFVWAIEFERVNHDGL